MGKVAAGMKKNKTKKKGRPSLLDLRMRNLNNQEQHNSLESSPNSNPRRSTRRNPNLNGNSPESDWISGDDDDDERKEKKVKLVVRLPPSNYGSDSNAADGDNAKINASANRSGDHNAAGDNMVVKAEKATEALQGSPLESGPTVPLPDKKLLVFILDRLQKKDTYGVFSEAVDPNELPDYFEIIEHPMDFGTVRTKLDEGQYSNLDEFESDVLLICANAMQYNAPDTVYFRQAKSIQDLAKRDFQNLRQVNDEGEPQPRIVRRGRPPNLKKSLSGPPLERIAPESSPDATLATGVDNDNNNSNSNAVCSNSYNLRKAHNTAFRFQSTDALYRASSQCRNNETYTDYTTDWNSEFPASILKAEAKHGKKLFSVDENRRATYKRFHPSALDHDPSALATLNGNVKQLTGVGLHSEHGYARSLARFAANLGPVVWKIASKKIDRALPSGVNFGPGWVGENEALPRPQTPALPLNNLVPESSNQSALATSDALAGEISNKEQSALRNNASRLAPVPIYETQRKLLLQNQNGFNHLPGYDFAAQAELLRARLNLPTGKQQSVFQDPHPTALNHSEQNLGASSGRDLQNLSAAPMGPPASKIVPSQQRPHSIVPVPPDLNVRFQGPGSPNSSFRIGSPQPDLALQL